MTAKKRPDYNIFVNTGTEDSPRTERIGAAWQHSRGEGLNITLFALPINGKAVAFPNKDKEEQHSEAEES